MKNTFGSAVTVTLFGESHGAEIGAVLDGLAPGIVVDENEIFEMLTLRRPYDVISTARVEKDDFRIVSGVYNGKTTGTPLCILIPNMDVKDGEPSSLARPGHADYTANVKYHGFQDARGGGHFSGRLTAALTAVGAVAMSALCAKGIKIGTHISSLGGVCDRPFNPLRPDEDIEKLRHLRFAVLDGEKEAEMRERILTASQGGDSVGGVLETAVAGVPAGVGEPWFDTVEGVIAHAMFSIPAVKGVEFGNGFRFAEMKGGEANDAFFNLGSGIKTRTNHNGGVNGGITNGMPLIFRCAIKPTPSIALKQETVDLKTGKGASLALNGRYDPAIVHRARSVVDGITALVLCDLLTVRYGTDWLAQ